MNLKSFLDREFSEHETVLQATAASLAEPFMMLCAVAEKALNLLTEADAWSLSVLASAHAASGDFDLATELANQARSKVAPKEENSLGTRIDRQIFAYQQERLEFTRTANEKEFISPQDRGIR